MSDKSNTSKESKENASGIKNAVHIIYQAIQDSRKDLKDSLEEDYEKLLQALAAAQPELKSAIKDFKQHSVEKFHQAQQAIKQKSAETVSWADDKVHERPWVFIGFTGLICALLGFLWGKSCRKNSSSRKES